jgi:TPR repeat protein
VHTEAEAADGNADAQTWLAKKYFWGLGGVERDEMAAR